MSTLPAWIEAQYAHSAQAMLRSISAVGITKARPGFGQTIVAAAGSVVASPVLGAYDPDPDYFFHWFRDSAVVMDALRLLYLDGTLEDGALAQFADFVNFSSALQRLDGRALTADASWRGRVRADYEQYLRSDAELEAVHGDAVAGETRVNADGSLDISRWGRPQNDGPPLRALTLLRWLHTVPLDARVRENTGALLRADLQHTYRHWQDACYDIWEEEKGQHYYTLCVSAAALEQGSAWFQTQRESREAQQALQQARAIRQRLDGYWSAADGHYRSRVLESGQHSSKELDIAVILAAIHAPNAEATHSVHDPKMHATLQALERLFTADYRINQPLPMGRAPAMGRYRGDVYYSGGAYYFSTLGAAEFCFRAAAAGRDGGEWRARGDAYLETVRTYTPPTGDLAEQFDQTTGAPNSAKQLAWSHAAFISCVATRRTALKSLSIS
jgi:glucoamylase